MGAFPKLISANGLSEKRKSANYCDLKSVRDNIKQAGKKMITKHKREAKKVTLLPLDAAYTWTFTVFHNG